MQLGGGTGFIGSRLTKHLANNGYDVTVISRMPGVKHITWHQLEKNGIPKGITSVINVAGQNVLDPTRRWTPGYMIKHVDHTTITNLCFKDSSKMYGIPESIQVRL